MLESELPLTFRNVLPRLWYLALVQDSFVVKSTGEYYDFSGNMIFQFKTILKKISGVPDDSVQKLHANICSYCKNAQDFSGKGDHVVNGRIHKKYTELDNLVYRLNCCRSCNSSKHDKDMVDWWINHKQENVIKLTKNHFNVYCRAMWKYCTLSNTLDDTVEDYHIKAIEQLHEAIDNSTYDKIWQKNGI